MNNPMSPAPAVADAQPNAVVNPIDAIIDSAETEGTQPEVADEPAKPDQPKELSPAEELEKLRRAKARDDRRIGKLTAQKYQYQKEADELRARFSKPEQATQKPLNTGEPKETDFNNYAEYMRAVNKYDLQQELAQRDSKQQVTQQTAQEQAWIGQREQAVALKAQEFAKENPEVIALVEEYGEVIDELPPAIQRAFLEADNAPLAFFNLAKEGRLEELANMSPARAAMEIGRAQMQAPAKPKTKAPTPLPASRGSVASGKSLDQMSGKELLKWSKSKE
jgi:hypothetical protein